MEKVVKIFRHVDCEGPGYLLTVLERNKIPYQIVKVDEDENIPTSLENALALVFMGGGMSVNDELPWIDQECDLIHEAKSLGIPVLGHCLGAQLMAKALGAKIYENRAKEIGWFDVFSTTDSAYFAGIDLPEEFFHWHGETFTLPEGATNILSSEHCENQCFIIGNMIGFQCHIEMTEALVQEWVQRFSEQLASNISTVQTPEVILQDLSERVRVLNNAADKIYQYWIDNFLRG